MLLIIYTRTLTELYRYTFSAYTPSTCSKLPLQLNIRADIYTQISTFVYISPLYIVRDRPRPYIFSHAHTAGLYIYTHLFAKNTPYSTSFDDKSQNTCFTTVSLKRIQFSSCNILFILLQRQQTTRHC